MEPNVLVTGGAGYVGAHACLALSRAGYRPVVYDNLSNGHAAFARWGPLEIGDIRDAARLDAAFAAHRPVALLHFAALADVGQSMREPELYFEINASGTGAVAAAAVRAGVEAAVFSSTCAVYGEPLRTPIGETHPQRPINPYGASKQAAERAMLDAGLRCAVLRYFNAAGAAPEEGIGERHDPESHALPLAIAAAAGRGPAFQIFGTDYPTRDGTAVRDYVHVLDLAAAHVMALNRLLAGGDSQAFNLGRGEGTTVRELCAAVGALAPFAPLERPRREGDPAVLVADSAKAREILGWRPSRGLSEIVRSAFEWHENEAAARQPS